MTQTLPQPCTRSADVVDVMIALVFSTSSDEVEVKVVTLVVDARKLVMVLLSV